MSQRGRGICGPWIPDDGEIVTHTVSKAGKMSQLLWTSKVTQKSLCLCLFIFTLYSPYMVKNRKKTSDHFVIKQPCVSCDSRCSGGACALGSHLCHCPY